MCTASQRTLGSSTTKCGLDDDLICLNCRLETDGMDCCGVETPVHFGVFAGWISHIKAQLLIFDRMKNTIHKYH